MRKPILTLTVIAVLLAVAASFSAAQYTPGDVVVTDQRPVGSTWPVWGITPQGSVYTVTSSLSFFGWSIAPGPDNRTVWVSGTGRQGASTTRSSPSSSGTVRATIIID